MARGWESKGIEQQQEAVANRRAAAASPEISAADAAKQSELDALHLARVRILADLQRACRPAHRGMLEAALADVQSRIGAVKDR